jgi:hypothetical protein
VSDNEKKTLERFGQAGWLHFLPIGRPLVDPLKYQHAKERVIFGKPGGGRLHLWVDGSGEVAISTSDEAVVSPSQEEGRASLLRFQTASKAIRRALGNGRLATYVHDAEGAALIVDEMYWWRADADIHNRLLGGVGVPDHLVGAQVLVDPAHLSEWADTAESAMCEGSSNDSAEQPGQARQPTPRRVKQERVEEWFKVVRCPNFEGQQPPPWRSCWEAAKAHFAPDKVVRDVLLAARREAAPSHWQKPGPNREQD